MSECTKGELKWERHGNRCNLYMDGAWIGELYVGYGMKSIEEMEANAKQLIRRWNAFGDGGLVEELRDVIDDMLKGLRYMRQTHEIPYGFGIDRLEKTGKAALAKS